MVYCVTYELKSKLNNYTKFYEALKTSGSWWHQSENIWFISTSDAVPFIRDYLSSFLFENDKIFVIKCANDWAGIGYNKEEYEWIRTNLK